ncbi:dihydrofolate reductase family protein [Pseudonocardia acaciae]|uniref:dihydrofolate reductase family protein n=1 Tax=Pseudonocardia acaciae TaxID=551276 RepID=UPI00049163DA|nr:dihydrofolate reductase family protein [Pseudonocardia acaciae]
MGKIIISENVTLDGVVEDPTGETGFTRGGWFGRLGTADREAWAKVYSDEALAAEAMLLGRRSYEFFAERWPSRTGAWADRLNGMPKYVVSSTLEHPAWQNTTVLGGDVVDEVTKLAHELTGDIVVYGSSRLVPTLIDHDLADELRLLTYPVLVGDGVRLFGPTSNTKPLHLLEARTIGHTLTLLTYRLVRDA